jgi:hypothetical protein
MKVTTYQKLDCAHIIRIFGVVDIAGVWSKKMHPQPTFWNVRLECRHAIESKQTESHSKGFLRRYCLTYMDATTSPISAAPHVLSSVGLTDIFADPGNETSGWSREEREKKGVG